MEYSPPHASQEETGDSSYEPLGEDESAYVSDIEKTRYMAEMAKPHADKAATGRAILRASHEAEDGRTARKIGVYEATLSPTAGIITKLDKVYDAGLLSTAELVIPALGRATNKARAAYRQKVVDWAQKQENRAEHAVDQAATHYDATEGHPHYIADIKKAWKEAQKTKKAIALCEESIVLQEKEIAKIDSKEKLSKSKKQRRQLLQDLADQATSAIKQYKTSRPPLER